MQDKPRNKYIELGKILLYFLCLYAFYAAFAVSMWYLYLVINPQPNKPRYNDSDPKGKLIPLGLELDDSQDLIPNSVFKEEQQKILCKGFVAQNSTTVWQFVILNSLFHPLDK